MSVAVAGGAGNPRIPLQPIVVLTALATVLMAGAIGVAVVRLPALFRLDIHPTPGGLLLLLAVLAIGGVLLRRPHLALAPLVACIYLNLSEVLVRFHGLPSLLQLTALPLAAGAWWAATGRIRPGRTGADPLTLLLVAGTVLLFLSSLWAADRARADQRVLEMVKALVLYGLLTVLIDSRRRLRAAIWSAVGSAALLAGLGLWQVTTSSYGSQFAGLARIKHAQIYGTHFEPRIAGPLGDPNFFAQILCLAVPLALSLAEVQSARWRRWAAWVCGAVTAAALVFTYSRGTFLALAVVGVLWLLRHGLSWRTAAAGAAVLAVAAVVLPEGFVRRLTTLSQMVPGEEEVLHPDSSFAKRKLLARGGWEMFQDHLLGGVGAANYTVHLETYADEIGSAAREYDEPGQVHYPHNLFLEVATETGVPGLVLFGLALVASFSQLAAARRAHSAHGDRGTAALAAGVQVALTGYLVSSLFLHGHYPRYLYLAFALSTALWALAPPRPRPLPAPGRMEGGVA